ncbi:hypothetical protein ERX37_07910 [Macrococcus hajekii]|uniref:Uncharacterized protein n=1 Tax=Macrococcus hajekii TaxID=198482 RepID=A0A4R6BIK9_9STAP|nr:hypothetical protein [Macrococcus hajekii]TDM01418.1 hypothetical protein ERX37_07910 [Macrococcus hajekii]GGA99809.1 hypothetical protein GCM10007190_04820 [Macrococcus hajekii]
MAQKAKRVNITTKKDEYVFEDVKTIHTNADYEFFELEHADGAKTFVNIKDYRILQAGKDVHIEIY